MRIWGLAVLIDARRELFDNQKYDRIVLFEDDMTLIDYPNGFIAGRLTKVF